MRILICTCVALGCGLFLTWVDSRPNFDDTGVLAMLVLISSFGLACVTPRWAWCWALLIGGGIWLNGTIAHHNYGSVLALIFAFVGAYLGVGCHHAVRKVWLAGLRRVPPR